MIDVSAATDLGLHLVWMLFAALAITGYVLNWQRVGNLRRQAHDSEEQIHAYLKAVGDRLDKTIRVVNRHDDEMKDLVLLGYKRDLGLIKRRCTSVEKRIDKNDEVSRRYTLAFQELTGLQPTHCSPKVELFLEKKGKE